MRRGKFPQPLIESLEERCFLSGTTGIDGGALSFAGPLPQLFSARLSTVVLQQLLNQINSTNNKPTTPVTTPAAPVAPSPSIPPVSVTVQKLSFGSALVITGTSNNDFIVVRQSGQTLMVQDASGPRSFAGPLGNLIVHAGSGNETITIDSSVNIATLLYAGTGNSTFNALGTGQTTVVAMGGGVNTITGNGSNTSYWVDACQTLHASAAEMAAGRVHRIATFYQPWSNDPANPNYISLQLSGQNLRDPVDATTTTRLINRSLWGTGPVMSDVNQGQTADCYFLADLESLAQQQPAPLENMAVDLGDGTYAVEFQRGGTPVYVRVDGDLPSASYGLTAARPGSDGDLWAPIMEKAYAFFRTGANSYSSLNMGWTGDAFNALGVANTLLTIGRQSVDQIYTQFSAALGAGKAMTLISNSIIASGTPIIATHAYSITGVSRDSTGALSVILRNPWGVDGAGSDANPYDGLVTLTLVQLEASFQWGSVTV